MGTVKIWHYVGSSGEERGTKVAGTPLQPYVARQQVITSDTAIASAPSPAGTHLARIEVAVGSGSQYGVRFKVGLPGESADADTNDPLLSARHHDITKEHWLHLPPGATISFVESD